MSQVKINAFICDEVARQGFKRHSPEWCYRVGAMAAAWNHALQYDALALTPKIIRLWGMMVEPQVNAFGWRDCGVSVGGRECPSWLAVPGMMKEWCRTSFASPDIAYVQFEMIHPFRDGNGRTGKIIHNWLLGTLKEPVLVKDFFGGGIP